MRSNNYKSVLKHAALAASVLLLASGAAFAQQQVNLSAGPVTATPGGTPVPMWGYSCGTAVALSTASCAPLNPLAATNPLIWSPVVITVPTGQDLQINLTNNLTFQPPPPTGGTAPPANGIPTSLVIVGQLGGGLGTTATSTPSPDHTNAQPVTWPIAGSPPGASQVGIGTPPAQSSRVQSFATEVAPTNTASLCWGTSCPTPTPALKPGTYLIESGTHPSIQGPMGLYGILVVTSVPVAANTTASPPITALRGLAYPGVNYDAELPLLLSEIDPVQNEEVSTAVNTAGFSETAVWALQGGPITALTLTSGGSGYTSIPTVSITGGGSGATATAALSTTIGGISVTAGGTGYVTTDTVCITGGGGTGATATIASVDPVTQAITGISVTNVGTGYSSSPTITFGNDATCTGSATGTGATAVATFSVGAITLSAAGNQYPSAAIVTFSGGNPVAGATAATATATSSVNAGQGCGNIHTCYPPAVNYTPLYYLINGTAFDKTNPATSLFAAAPTSVVTGNVLVRLVNAGLRMHVPSIVGAQTGTAVGAALAPAGFALIAEDGNVLPGVPRVQSEVFMPAGKTNDVMINVPAAPSGGTATALPIFDRELSLSGNAIARDAGMLAYISVNGAGLPAFAASASAAAQANPDTYNSVIAGKTLAVLDPGKGLIANDVNISGVQVQGGAVVPGLTLNADGTFTYTGTPTTFTYCGNGAISGAACALVTLGAAPMEAASGIVMNNITYNANATFLKIQPPGILSVDKDAAGYPLTVAGTTAGSLAVTLTGTGGAGTATVDANGGFSATVSAAGTYTFTYSAQNSQGVQSSSTATVTLVFPAATNLAVTVLDGKDVLAARLSGSPLPTCTGASPPASCITDYRWVIEEDRTFYVNPNCSANPPPAGCPGATTAGLGTTGIVPTFGTNFHTSYMPVIATGCTGQLSCEGGQTIFDPTTGTHINAVCDLGNGVCRPDSAGSGFTANMPGTVHLDPTKRYYLTIFPGDAGNPFANGNLSGDCTNGVAAAKNPGACGHGMGGTPIGALVSCTGTTCTATVNGVAVTCTPATGQTSCVPVGAAYAPLTVLTQPDPYPPSKLSVFVFQDDFPLNGEHDGGGGIDVLSPNEPGLGGFNITLFDDAGGPGDATGQMTYDMFNQPLVNSLAGTIDPATNLDACPVSQISRIGTLSDANGAPIIDPRTHKPKLDPTQTGITGTIVTCPTYESDGRTLSPLAGQAVIANLMPGRYGVVATPAADRIARGEEWLQTNTLDGQKAHDSFLRIGEPSFFQEFGPAGYHVSIGFANPGIINARLPGVCGKTDPNITGNCTPGNTVTGLVTTERMSRTPDERLYSSGDNSSFAFTQCYVSLGDADGEDFAFTKCDSTGHFKLTGLPDGDWRITVFDQWNDMLVDGLSTPVRLGVAGAGNLCPGQGSTQRSCNMGDIAMNQWQANIYTRTFFDATGTGLSADIVGAACNGTNPPAGCNPKPGLTLVPTNIRFRDGSYSNFNNTDLAGNAGFNEVFPLFSWYVIETDSTRYKNTGTHVVYDAGGPSDGTSGCGGTGAGAPPPCGTSTIAGNMANTFETVSVPTALQVPGAVYCATADCNGYSIKNPGSSAAPSSCSISPTTGRTSCTGTSRSTGRIDPPWVLSEGWQGFSGQNSFIEFGKTPFAAGENGGIRGEVIYASTRPFDDPQLLIHTSWTPDVPGVTINLYQVGTAPDGSQSLTLVDTTKTSSFDDWAQGFYPGTNKPYMNCPGQLAAPTTAASGDLFFFTLFNQPMWLDAYNNGGTPAHTMPNNSQFKCYDGMHNWNQVQPAPYDGMYTFPSIVSRNPTTGSPAGAGSTNGTAGSMTGTNCTICVANPTDPTAPMLPDGQYVVEMIVPPGYELVKEEDKNILIGDNYIAPVTQEFPGLGSAIYILPDQSSVAAVYNANQGALSAFNATNAQNPTQAFGRQSALPSHEGDTGSVESFWPCVGATRIVPDYISLFPQSAEVAPFAGAKRNLCDRKLVQLDDQTSALAKFWVFTSAHVAAHFTGVITDDFTSEFDPFSPQFGEKFSPANLPVAIKDWSGQEISRVYADQWGTYDGLTYSTWEVNPPNPTGYAPTMMVTCMNDPGTGSTPDPFYNPAYSQFCYEIPFMPGQTQYMDTPVVPTSAFAGAGYNNPDCDYPDATPAVSEVDGDGVGPYVSAGGTLNIYALGTVPVNNYGYNGPSATTAPFNAKTVNRTYSFGTTAGTVALVGSDGVVYPLGNVSWGDLVITGNVPAGLPNCAVQQQAQYEPTGTTSAQCGQLVITAANGKQSVDTVSVTIGGKAPTHVAPTASVQAAIDAASPGDMLIIDPATRATGTAPAVPAVHQEVLLMWKPVRLQGVGAVASVINANTHPAGKMDVWRRQVNCLFGLSISGYQATSSSGTNPYDPSGAYTCGTSANFGAGSTTLGAFQPTATNPQVDRLPMEAVVGWNAGLNGNLAELLQEPSLMGALEGAAITVLSKGVFIPDGSTDIFGANSATAGAFPAGTRLLTSADCTSANGNPFPSNFYCNPSSIDGLTIENSSQGGGGIFVHGWGHNLQIANNRVTNNAGTLSGGINVSQGEYAPSQTVGGLNAEPGTCQSAIGLPAGAQLQYCYDVNVNMHHNAVTKNSSIGDELFSATPAGAGGVSICTGSDFYKFNYNWVCGNLSTGDGGGVAHIGFSYYGDIEHNSILFNQSSNPTIATNGGGLLLMGAPDVDPTCGSTTDADCVPTPPSSVGPSDGVGPELMVNANLIMGNAAESGSGGGIALQNVNGSDVIAFPNLPGQWHHITLQNNIVVNNVAGWDGGGISLLDALNTDIVNNTIASNVSTASSGVLFNTLGAPLASTQGPGLGGQTTSATSSRPQPAGLVSQRNSAVLEANILALPAIPGSPGVPAVPAGTVTCPVGHGAIGTGSNALRNGRCKTYSYPLIASDIFWQNRSYHIGVGGLGVGAVNQQNVVTLYDPPANFGGGLGTPAPNQQSTGACTTDTNFWDIGVRGDTGPGNHSLPALAPTYSVITSTSGYTGTGNLAGNPSFASQYCNGSRIPPESKASGWQVPPGIADATVPNPRFNLRPAATVDEGNNWINIAWGPLSMSNPALVTVGANGAVQGNGTILGNYALAFGSPANDVVPASIPHPLSDFFGNTRPDQGAFDIGAIETTGVGTTTVPTVTSVSPPSGRPGTTVAVIITGTNLTAATAVATSAPPGVITVGVITSRSPTAVTATFAIAASAAAATYNVSVTTPGGTATCTGCFAVALGTLTSITPNHGVRGNTGATGVVVQLVGTNLTGASGLAGLGGGVTLAPGTFVVNSSTSITATLNIATTATLGVRNLAVSFPTGPATNTIPFTVGPFLTGIAPTAGVRGTSVAVTITGVGLTGATAVNVTGGNGNVTATSVTAVSDTQVTATLNIAAAANTGNRTVSVTVTPPGGTAGTSNTVTFRVTGATVGFAGPGTALTTTPANPTTKNGVVTVTNTATGVNAGPLTLTAAPGIARTAGTGTFSITGGTCAAGTVLSPSPGPGNSCTINVQYVPPATCTTTATGTCTSTAHVTLTDTGAATASQNGGNFNAN
jgi:hypothetical protein